MAARAAIVVLTKNQELIDIRRVCIYAFLLLLCVSRGLWGESRHQDDSYIYVSPDIVIDRLVVKFDEQARVRVRSNHLVSLADVNLEGLYRAVGSHQIEPLFLRDETALDDEYANHKADPIRQKVNKNSYYQIKVQNHADAQRIINALRVLPYVQDAYVEPKSEPAEDIPPPTPDFAPDQGYLYDPPEGIAANFCWAIPGGRGSDVRIIDIEGNRNADHEDFEPSLSPVLAGNPVGAADWINHGTAVAGEICSDSNAYGVTGIAYEAQLDLISIDGIGTAAAIDVASSLLQAGDMILIELHTPGPRYNFATRPDQMGYVPVEYFNANFDAIQMASAKGITVVEAGGNGYENLDDPLYEDRFDRDFRNSHAIIVGAGAPPDGEYGPDRSRLYFSNYGSRIDLQGWGKNVVTTGYGGLFDGDGDDNQYYTATFGGTSSASPMIAGSVACLQGIYMAQYGYPLSPDIISSLLITTGSQQPNPTEWIGPRPNLNAAYQILPEPGLTASPLYIEETVVGGQGTTVGLILTSRNESSTFDFSISIDDTLEGNETSGWIEISPTTGTVGPLGDQELLVSLSSDILEDTTTAYKGMITVDYGSWTLLDVPVFFNVTCNDTNYSLVDSDTPSSDEFEWVDITSIGTELEPTDYHNSAVPASVLDDGTSKAIAIGFPFNFYNTIFTSVYAGINGGLSFASDEVNLNGFFATIDFPSPGIEAFLAPFWNDLTIDPSGTGHGALYYYNSPARDSLVIEYYQVGNFSEEADSMITFEVILTSDHKITYQYLDVGDFGLGYSALTGLSRDSGCRYVKYLSSGSPSSHILHDSLRVDIVPQYEIMMQAGDADNSGEIDIDDVVFLIQYIFSGGPAPVPLAVGDCDCSGEIDIDDVVYLVQYIFLAGPAPCMFSE